MVYAPVVIWTLNRYEHLKCCIESLINNEYAINTELFISVDYPPDERYLEGYLKIREYLAQGIPGFKSVHIIYHEINLGPMGNMAFIVNKAYEKFDRIIITEDDNEFSPFFLEYMDYLLDKYEDNDDIFSIGGYSYPIDWENDGKDIVKVDNMYSAWGSGLWRKKYEVLLENLKQIKIEQVMKSFCQIYNIFKNNPVCFANLIYSYLGDDGIMCNKTGDLIPVDSAIVLYLITNNKSVIIPKISQVVNHGSDGTGIHCTIDEEEENKNNEIICKWRTQLPLKMNDNISVLKVNHNRLAKFISCDSRDICSNWIQYFLYRCRLKKRNYVERT